MKATAALTARRSAFGGPLPAAFYDRPTETVARELLGAVLEHRCADGTVAGRIVEVEAYPGPHDPACHSAHGVTARNRHLHGPPGTAYVYLIYGLHWCVNAVTREVGFGSAVLIRAVEPMAGLEHMRRRRGDVSDRELSNGPGKVCQALGIDRSLDGASLSRGALRILRGDSVPDARILVTARIGITRAVDWPLRFVVRDNPWVSKGVPADGERRSAAVGARQRRAGAGTSSS